ncbi:MAG: DUF1292 domain-containing protein, partial [Schwartzia sp.]|nr:DUF1292 domain-containing protein [Schwartzia sp. (in: firmicutes)]
GNQYYYAQELILQVNGEKYALLVPTVSDEEAEEGEHHHEDGCGCEDEEDAAFFAKIVLDENGEEAYIEPTDEEFEAVCAAYDELLEGEDEEEEDK